MKKILLSLLIVNILGCGDKIDSKGFYIEGKNIGLHKETKSKYDKDGYDKNGYNVEGFNKNGYNAKGFDKDGIDKNGFDENKVFQRKIYQRKILKESYPDIIDSYPEEKISPIFFGGIEEIAFQRFKDENIPQKKEFEKTIEYEKRLEKYIDEKKESIKKFREGMYTFLYSTYAEYDADREIWRIKLPSYYNFKINDNYNCDIYLTFPNDLSKTKLNKEKSKYENEIFIYNYPMALNKAKIQKNLKVSIKYIFKFVSNDKYYETSSKFVKNYTAIEYNIKFYGIIVGYQISINDKVITEEIFD